MQRIIKEKSFNTKTRNGTLRVPFFWYDGLLSVCGGVVAYELQSDFQVRRRQEEGIVKFSSVRLQ